MKKFTDFNLHENTRRFMELLSFKELTPIQQQVIPSALAGKDVIGISPTGSGKTHAYLIPLMEIIDPAKDCVQAVVTAPTRELASQIYEKARLMTKADESLNIQLIIGGQDRVRKSEQLKRQQPHLVIGTPGRIKDLFLSSGLLRIDTSEILIVDEADMTLEYGFLDDIDAFAGKMKDDLRMMAFSATMSPQLKPFIKKYMHHPVTYEIKDDTAAFNPKIHHILVPCYHRTYVETILRILPGFNPYVCLIFANTRVETGKIYDELQKAGVDVVALHGDLESRKRKQVMKEIMTGKHSYIVATDIASRGIDLSTISHVISCGFPEDLEFYIHRAGRTARAGNEGTCYALYHESDDAAIRSLMKSGIHFDHARFQKNGWQELTPYGRPHAQKDDDLKKRIAMIYTKKNTKVKPGYKKKRKQEIARIHQKKKQEFIRGKIREQKKAMYKQKARKENSGN